MNSDSKIQGAQNKIFLDDIGLIHGIFEGDQNYYSINQAAQQIEEFIKVVRQQNKPAIVLIDITNVVKQDSGARKAGWEGLSTLKYDKWAMFGSNPFIKNVANLVGKATGLSHRIKVFTSREEAEKWLKS